jgi:hypothetical protein
MFYTGLDPLTMEEVYVPRDMEEKQMQRALLQFDIPENKRLVIKALQKAGREDLIGYGINCLVTPLGGRPNSYRTSNNKQKGGKNYGKNTGWTGSVKKNKGRT